MSLISSSLFLSQFKLSSQIVEPNLLLCEISKTSTWHELLHHWLSCLLFISFTHFQSTMPCSMPSRTSTQTLKPCWTIHPNLHLWPTGLSVITVFIFTHLWLRHTWKLWLENCENVSIRAHSVVTWMRLNGEPRTLNLQVAAQLNRVRVLLRQCNVTTVGVLVICSVTWRSIYDV